MPVATRLFVLGGFALLQAGCSIILWPLPAGAPVPDLMGTWDGVWAGAAPITMVIAQQDGNKVAGVMTYSDERTPFSTGITGELGIRNGVTVLLMTAASLNRTDLFEFTVIHADRLAGLGSSTGLGGHRGTVVLTKRL